MARRRRREERMSGVGHSFPVSEPKTSEPVEEGEIRTYIPTDKLIFEASLLGAVGTVITLFTGGSVIPALIPLVFVAVHIVTSKDKIYMKEDED